MRDNETYPYALCTLCDFLIVQIQTEALKMSNKYELEYFVIFHLEQFLFKYLIDKLIQYNVVCLIYMQQPMSEMINDHLRQEVMLENTF